MDGDRASASIANSRIHTHGVSAGFMPLFQVLNSWESEPHSRLLVGAGIVLEVIQFSAFALTPYFQYQEPIVEQLVQVVFATIGPLWYRPFGPFDYTYYAIVYFIAAAAVIATILFFTLLALKKIESTNWTVSHGVRYAAECIGGWLFLPLLHLFLGGMNCSNSVLINFPEHSCGDALHSAVIAVGVVCIVGTAAIGIVISTTLSDTNPQSSRLRSRPHNYVEALVVVVKLALVIFFHILVERNATGSYNIMVVVASVGLLAVHAKMLPFYNHSMASIRCATYLAVAFVGVVNCITVYSSHWFHLNHINSFIMIALLPFAAYGGLIVSELRPNGELLFKIRTLSDKASVPRHPARFPFFQGVMSNDIKLCSTRFKTLELDIINEYSVSHTKGDPPSWDEIVVKCSEVLVPYVDNVLLPTDAELACRFVHMHRQVTNMASSANMLAFAARIFMKAVVLFKRSGIARFNFANFLYIYANRLNLALELLNELDLQVHDEHDALVLYSSYKVGVKVKELFGVRDNTHLHTFQKARQFHKEALGDMASFWAKLMESKGDIVGLAILSNQLTDRSQNAMVEYERSLTSQKGDRLLLSAFAMFLEHVMCDEPAAEGYRLLAEEIAEEKKKRIMRGSRSKNDVSGAATPKSSLEEIDDDEDDSPNASSLTTYLFIFLVLVIGCSIAIFVLQQVRQTDVSLRTLALSSIGSAASHAQQAIFLALVANNLRNDLGCANTTCSHQSFWNALYNVSTAEANMRIYHNLATYGSHSAPYDSTAMRYVSELTTTNSYFQVGALWITSSFAYFTRKASSTILSFFMESNALVTVVEPWMNIHLLSMHLTRLVNQMYAGDDYSRSFLYLTSNPAVDALYSLGIFSDHQIADVRALSTSMLAGLIVAFGAALIFLMIAYFAFNINLETVGHSKATVLKLFTLIPYPTQEMLRTTAANRIEQFEKLMDEEPGDTCMNDPQDTLDEPDELLLSTRVGSANGGAQKAPHGLEDDIHRMSRFFGNARSASQASQHFFPSILKNPAKPRPKKKKCVQFKIDGEIHRSSKKLREPKVKLDSKPKDLVQDLERSIKDIEQQNAQEIQLAKQRKAVETEKMISGGLRIQQTTTRHKQHSNGNTTVGDLKMFGELVLRPLISVLCLAGLVVTVLALNGQQREKDTLHSILRQLDTMDNFVGDFQRAEIAAAHFLNFGRMEHYNAFVDYIAVSKKYTELRETLVRGFTTQDAHFMKTMEQLTATAQRHLNGLLQVMAIGARALVGMGVIPSMSNVPLLATFVSGDRVVTPDFTVRYPALLSSPEEYVFNGTLKTASTTNMTAENLLKEALRRFSSRKVSDDRRLFDFTFNNSIHQIELDLEVAIDTIVAAQERQMTIAVALAATASVICFLKVCLLLAAIMSHKKEWSAVVFDVTFFAVLCVTCIAILVTSIVALNRASATHDTIAGYQDAWLNALQQRHNFFNRQRFALMRYVSVGDERTLLEIQQNYSVPILVNQYSILAQQMNNLGLSDVNLGIAQTADIFFWQIQRVSMWLYKASQQAASGQSVSPPDPPFLATYDYNEEIGSAADSVVFESDSALQYSTPTLDRNRSAAELFAMSRQALTGRRAFSRFFVVYDALSDNVITALHTALNAAVSQKSSDFNGIAAVALALFAVGSFVGAYLALLPFMRTFIASLRASEMAKMMTESLFVPTLRKCRLCLFLVLLAITAQFGVAVTTIDNGADASSIVMVARSRELLLLQSATIAIKVNQSAATSNLLELTQHLSTISSLRAQLNDARNALYFASSATSTAFGVVSSLSSAQRALTFNGGSLSLDSQYLTWLARLDSLVSIVPSLVAKENLQSSLAAQYFLSSASQAQISNIVSSLTSAVDQLTEILRRSNEQYDSDMRAAVLRSAAPDIALLIVVVVLTAGQLYFVFLPVVGHLQDEERGTKLMLNMIPQNVREAVPKITLYLETGVLIQEEDERKVYGRRKEVAQFLSHWQHFDNQEASFAILDESEICQILIDARGVVQFANNKTADTLGYDDLKGRNISCLLDEPLRSLHDGFLQRFVLQGTSRIVGGSRDVVARTKCGDHVHLYLYLDEAISFGGATFFLGGLERYTIDDVNKSKEGK